MHNDLHLRWSSSIKSWCPWIFCKKWVFLTQLPKSARRKFHQGFYKECEWKKKDLGDTFSLKRSSFDTGKKGFRKFPHFGESNLQCFLDFCLNCLSWRHVQRTPRALVCYSLHKDLTFAKKKTALKFFNTMLDVMMPHHAEFLPKLPVQYPYCPQPPQSHQQTQPQLQLQPLSQLQPQPQPQSLMQPHRASSSAAISAPWPQCKRESSSIFFPLWVVFA